MRLTFSTYDVFTEARYAGNPLAVVLGADGLADAAMQAIAREFNLSETVFVQTPQNPAHAARARIFTPGAELPFAGHPTVGCAIALAEERFGAGAYDTLITLEEKAGLVRCAVSREGAGASFAEFVAPRLPEEIGAGATDALVAEALSLQPHEIGFGRHIPTLYSAGVPFALCPLASPEALARATPNPAFDVAQLGASELYLYAPLPKESPHALRARMFAPKIGIAEDPATGSAAAALAGALMRFEAPGEGAQRFPIEQGVEMGRPSLIALTLEIAAGVLKETRIGGHAVKVSDGTIEV